MAAMAADDEFECIPNSGSGSCEDPEIGIDSDEDYQDLSDDSIAVGGVKVFLQDQPSVTFDYYRNPFMDEFTSITKTIIVNKQVDAPHIRCHKLEQGDSLRELVSTYHGNNAKAILLVTSDHEVRALHLEVCKGAKEIGNCPVLILPNRDGNELLRYLDEHGNSEVFAVVDVETPTLEYVSQFHIKEPTKKGKRKRVLQFVKEAVRNKLTYDLRGAIEKLMFSSEKPEVVSQDSNTFIFVMSEFSSCEKLVKTNEATVDVSSALQKLCRHMPSLFAKDLPFYILLAHRMHKERKIYGCEELHSYERFCTEGMEELPRDHVAKIFNGFIQRGDFRIMFNHDTHQSVSVFQVLEEACEEMALLSVNLSMKSGSRKKQHDSSSIKRMMWVSLALKLHSECAPQPMHERADKLWKDEIGRQLQSSIVLDKETCEALKNELEFANNINLQLELQLDGKHLATLASNDGRCRQFVHVKNCIQEVQKFLQPEHRLFEFSVNVRCHYTNEKMKTTILHKDLTGALDEGLSFVNELYTIWNKLPTPSDKLTLECKPWLKLLLDLIDISGHDSACHLKRFIKGETSVCIKYRDCIVECVKVKVNQLTIQQFLPLLKEFAIWNTEFLENYLMDCPLPVEKCSEDPLMSDFINELVRRFDDHHYLLHFFERLAEYRKKSGHSHDFILELISLNTPKLFAVKAGMQEETWARPTAFRQFLSNYIKQLTIDHKSAILRQLEDIIVAISETANEFQQQVLLIVQQEVTYLPDVTRGKKKVPPANQSLFSALKLAISHLCKHRLDKPVTSQQKFCWGLISSCCSKIPITQDNFEWEYSYDGVIKQFGHLFTNYYPGTRTAKGEVVLAKVFPQEITDECDDCKKFFEWVKWIQGILNDWKNNLLDKNINYDDILLYANSASGLYALGDMFLCHSLVLGPKQVENTKSLFLELFEELNQLLLLYIPKHPDAKWRPLSSLLADYEVVLPSKISEILSQHVVFPSECKQLTNKLLKNKLQPSIRRKFAPGSNTCYLTLTKDTLMITLDTLVNELRIFLHPLKEEDLDMLVFFNLLKSHMFDTYLKLRMKKPLETLVVSQLEKEPIESRLILLADCLKSTKELLVEIMKGTAKYIDIIADDELNLKELDTDKEFDILRKFFSGSSELAKQNIDISLKGIKCMVQLFQYAMHIENIILVCEQYSLQGCLQDQDIKKLGCLSQRLRSQEYRSELTSMIAIENMNMVKRILCIDESTSPKFLDLFVAVQSSNAFYDFVEKKQFVKVEGQARFYELHQLITAQLQHEDYNETVLNHLYVAFRYITPFMNKEQKLQQLMHKCTALNATDCMKHLETVSSNIALIQLWFSRTEGETLENIDHELNSIIRTGSYFFKLTEGETEIILQYEPLPAEQCPQLTEHSRSEAVNKKENDCELEPVVMENKVQSETKIVQWNSEQINDFVRKLGFLDTSKIEQGNKMKDDKIKGDKIKGFLHINEIAHKLLKVYIRLRELGHPEYLGELVTESLPCAVYQCTRDKKAEGIEQQLALWSLDNSKVDDKVTNAEQQLKTWIKKVQLLQNKYYWLLFFSVQKMLILYKLLIPDNAAQHLDAIVHEISFLCVNDETARKGITLLVKNSLPLSAITEGYTPMEVVGCFLRDVLNDHTLPHRYEDCTPYQCETRVRFSGSLFQDYKKQLHICHGFTQSHLLQVIIKIYNGVPESFEIFHCHPTSTEEEMKLFINRTQKHHSTFLVLEVNNLSYKLQELLIHLSLMIPQHQEVEQSEEALAPYVHFIETAPSLLREIPGVSHIEHKENPEDFEECHKYCRERILQPEHFLCIQLVYGSAGEGKTHYIKRLLASSPASVTIAVNEAFTPLTAIRKLRNLPLTQRNCAIFFNFTMTPTKQGMNTLNDSVESSQYAQYVKLMEGISWFFFGLLVLGYVEDRKTGLSFRMPGDLQWAIYVEVPFRNNAGNSHEALKLFMDEIPSLELLGTGHYIHPDTLFTLDEETKLVCKYLKAFKRVGTNGIDHLYDGKGQLVKFSRGFVSEKECHELLMEYMPDHVRTSKTTQQMFVKYMKRRCAFLDNLRAFNCNTGKKKQFNEKATDTTKLGSTLLKAMLSEASDFCNTTINRDWARDPHQQLVYDFKDNSSTIGLITLSPDEISDEDRTNFQKIGVEIPAVIDIYDRKVLDKYLSRSLNVELEDGQLSLIDEEKYVLTIDYTVKMLNIHERLECGIPVIIEGETGVGKTSLVEMLSKLWNYSLLNVWKKKSSKLLQFLKKSFDDIAPNITEQYPACATIVKAIGAREYASGDDLILLCQVPHPKYGQFYKVLREQLQCMRNDPIMPFLTMGDSQELPIEDCFTMAHSDDSPEATARLLHTVLSAQIKPTFHKINVHAALTPHDISCFLEPVFMQANALKHAFKIFKSNPQQKAFVGITEHRATRRIPFVTVFFDEVNTSSCLGLFRELIVDRSFDGEPIPDNIFIVAACNPHRGNSTATLTRKGEREAWMSGTYYVHRLHPSLHLLMCDYGALSTHQERDYINAKMKMVDKVMSDSEVATLSELIITCQTLMRQFAKEHLTACGTSMRDAEISSRCCVSQRDIQRVFTLYQWFMLTYSKLDVHSECNNNGRRAILVSLGIVYYMRLNNEFRKMFVDLLEEETSLHGHICFMKAFNDELNWYIKKVALPPGIAHTRALKENIFATIVCCVNRIPLIIVGAPGSSKTLSFNQVIANVKGQESKVELFRHTEIFPSLDPHYYQCSRRTTSSEVETVFSRAVNRQHTHKIFNLPVNCVVFMDEAGLPEESHESLKVLHYHLDKQEVSFVAITNNVLDAAKTNRAISLFRPESPDEDLETLAKGCLCSKPAFDINLKSDLNTILKFCTSYFDLMYKHECHKEIQRFFGLRDFIHFINYLRHRRTRQRITPQTVMEALERNFNGLEGVFPQICEEFLKTMKSDLSEVQQRGILNILEDSLRDRPHLNESRQGKHTDGKSDEKDHITENEVRYKLIIDSSEDDSIIRFLFLFGILQREDTRMFVCSDFPGDSHIQKINTIAAIRHSAIEGHTVVMSQTDDIHESFYDLFNQRFRVIGDPKEGIHYYTNIAIGAHSKPSRVHPKFQCIVVLKKSEIEKTPAPFLNRFEKYCISHNNLLSTVLDHMPCYMKAIIEQSKAKIQEFIGCVSADSSLYGFKPETLDSLLLLILPFDHEYQPLDGVPSVHDTPDVSLFLMQELLHALRHCAGFNIPTYPLDELSQDIKHILSLVRNDPDFDGILSGLNHRTAIQALTEATTIIHAEGVHDIPHILSPNVCAVIAILQQWLVLYLCKKLMQLMTPEALILHRTKIPNSYIQHYLVHQSHFSLKKLICNQYMALQRNYQEKHACHALQKDTLADSPAHSQKRDCKTCFTKLLCFTRCSPLINQLPSLHPSTVFDTRAVPDTKVDLALQDLVYPETNKLILCKLSGMLSQNFIQELLEKFASSNKTEICVLVANMQDISREVINHIRIMIEETESLHSKHNKLYVVLLHFPPAQFSEACYPSLFLQGWNHYYLDTIAHKAVKGVIDIQDWLCQICIGNQQTDTIFESDSLLQTLKDILYLSQSIAILTSKVYFGSEEGRSFNCCRNGFECTKLLKELLFHKGVGNILCKRFRAYWTPSVMVELLNRLAAIYSKNYEISLSITDSIQPYFKALFFDFLGYMLNYINDNYSLDLLFDADRTQAVEELFIEILKVLPTPELAEISVLCANLNIPKVSTRKPCFPFFKLVYTCMESLVEQCHNETNVKVNFLNEETSVVSTRYTVQDQKTILVETVTAKLKDTKISKGISKDPVLLAVEAMEQHDELWERYFTEFCHHKLHVESSYDNVAQQLLHAYFGGQTARAKIVGLHCHVRINHLEVANLACTLRPLHTLQRMHEEVAARPSVFDPSPPKFLTQTLTSSMGQKAHLLESSESLAVFVITTLFETLTGSLFPVTTSDDTSTLTALKQWYKAYCSVQSLPNLKQYVYRAIQSEECDESSIEARLNIMHATFVVLHMSPANDGSLLENGSLIFQALFTQHFDEALVLRDKCPRLAEIAPKAANTSRECQNDCNHADQTIERLLAHFFCREKQSYHRDDIKWFLELANEHVQWMVSSDPDYLKDLCIKMTKLLQQHSKHKLVKTAGAESLNVYKFYLKRILSKGSRTQQDGPLQLHNHDVRLQVGDVICAIPDLGPSGPYIPSFCLVCSCSSSGEHSKNLRMQQPLSHLYFLTVLEHLMTSQSKLSKLINIAKSLQRSIKHSTEREKVLGFIELEAVLQVVAQQLAGIIEPSKMGEVQPVVNDLNRLLISESLSGGETQGHGMVVALHMLKLLKSTRRFTELMTKRYDTLCKGIDCLKPFKALVKPPGDYPPLQHPLQFLCHCADEKELNSLYVQIQKTMLAIHYEGTQHNLKKLIRIAERYSTCSGHTNVLAKLGISKIEEAQPRSKLRFRMLVWLVVYYEYYNKKISSENLMDAIGSEEMKQYLQDECCVQLMQKFLCPSLMINNPERCNSDAEKHSSDKPAQPSNVDPVRQLFFCEEHPKQDQSDVDLRHSLANLIAVVLGCPSRSNHLWYHLFDSKQLKGTLLTGTIINPKCGPVYEHELELTLDGLLKQWNSQKPANKDTYTLHSLYFLLWANFGSFCISLLTQPEAEAQLHGPIISKDVPVRHYCVSQLREVWRHLRDSLGLSEEERSFFVLKLTWRFYKSFAEENTQGLFNSDSELLKYESMWDYIYQQALADFKENYTESAKHWIHSKLLMDLKRLERCYPYLLQEEDLIHSVVARVNPSQPRREGELHLLSCFACELHRLQAGGLLLPDLVQFYVWIHTSLANLVTYEKAKELTIGRVEELASKRSKEGNISSLYNRVKVGYNKYVRMAGGLLNMEWNAAAQMVIEPTISDDTPLLRLLSDDQQGRGNDWLWIVIEDITRAHNTLIENIYAFLHDKRDHPLARLLPSEPTKIFLAEINQCSCIMGKSTSSRDFVQLIHSHYMPPEISLEGELSPSQPIRLWPIFQMTRLEEDVVINFVAGKPLIESSSFRTPFKFQHDCQLHDSIVFNTVYSDVIDMKHRLPVEFQSPLDDALCKQVEYTFHSAGYDTMTAVFNSLKTVIGHLLKSLGSERSTRHLNEETLSSFMTNFYEQECEEVFEEIGMSTLAQNQLECISELPLPSLYSCFEMFASWMEEGVYDFSSLPFSLKAHISDKDRLAIETDLRTKWIGSQLKLLNALTQMKDFLHYSEKLISEIIMEASQMPIVEYIKEGIPYFADKTKLLHRIPRTILLQHYVSFRLSLKRLMLNMKQELEDQDRMEDGSKQPPWSDAVDDLWSQVLPNVRPQFDSGTYATRASVQTKNQVSLEQEAGKYTPHMVAEFLMEVKMDDYVEEFMENEINGELLLKAQSAALSDFGVSEVIDRFRLPSLFKKMLLTGSTECSMAEVVHILKEKNLDRYEDIFQQNQINMDMMVEADNKLLNEVLKQIGVVSAVDRLKLQVAFKQTAAGHTELSVSQAVDILIKNGLDKYSASFVKYNISGDMLLEAGEDLLKEVLQEIGVSSAVHRRRMKMHFENYYI